MKKLAIIGCLFIAACSGLPYGFDNVSYFNVVKLKHAVVQTQTGCNAVTAPPALPTLIDQAALVRMYFATAPADDEVRMAIGEIGGQIDEFQAAYSKPLLPSAAYCDLKMGIISDELTAVLTTIGNKR